MLSRENRTDCLHDQVLFLCWRNLQLSQSVCTVQLLQYIFLHKTVTILVVIIYFKFVAIVLLWYSSCWLSWRRTQSRVDVSVVSSDRVSSVVHYPQVSRVIVVSISSSHHSVVISLLVAELTIVPSEQWNIFKIIWNIISSTRCQCRDQICMTLDLVDRGSGTASSETVHTQQVPRADLCRNPPDYDHGDCCESSDDSDDSPPPHYHWCCAPSVELFSSERAPSVF